MKAEKEYELVDELFKRGVEVKKAELDKSRNYERYILDVPRFLIEFIKTQGENKKQMVTKAEKVLRLMATLSDKDYQKANLYLGRRGFERGISYKEDGPGNSLEIPESFTGTKKFSKELCTIFNGEIGMESPEEIKQLMSDIETGEEYHERIEQVNQAKDKLIEELTTYLKAFNRLENHLKHQLMESYEELKK